MILDELAKLATPRPKPRPVAELALDELLDELELVARVLEVLEHVGGLDTDDGYRRRGELRGELHRRAGGNPPSSSSSPAPATGEIP